jgi:hypothetical protein
MPLGFPIAPLIVEIHALGQIKVGFPMLFGAFHRVGRDKHQRQTTGCGVPCEATVVGRAFHQDTLGRGDEGLLKKWTRGKQTKLRTITSL